jgi:hypothetical protein
MVVEPPGTVDIHDADDPRSRLRQSRQELFELLQGFNGRGASGQGFPRSRVMRALVNREHTWMFGSAAALALALARPRWAWRALQWTAVQPLIRQHLLGWLFRKPFPGNRE